MSYEDLTYVQAHCDSRVLHAPTECQYCDKYPQVQLERIVKKINFTGHYRDDFALCPAEVARPLETINRWGGNVAHDAEREVIMNEYYAELERVLREQLND